MRNLGKTMHAALAIGVLAGVAACFSDPTSDLRDGPVQLRLSQEFIVQNAGTDEQLDITVVDAQGNTLPLAQPTYTSLDPAVATIAALNDPILESFPGNTLRKAIVHGVAAGMTQLVVAAEGFSETLTVVVHPVLSGTATATNTAVGPSTLVTIAAPAGAEFNTTGTVSNVFFGATQGTIISRTATEIVAVAPITFSGPVTVTNLTSLSSGLPVDSVRTDPLSVNQVQFTGTAVVSNTILGNQTMLTLTAPAGVTFTAGSSAVTFGATAGTILSRTATQIEVISPATFTGQPTVSNLVFNGVTMPAAIFPTPLTINAALFPGTVAEATTGENNLVDTIVVTATGGATFNTTGQLSQVFINGDTAWVVSRTATELRVVSRQHGTSTPVVTRVNAAGFNIASLPASAPFTVDRTTTEASEPANDNPGGTTVTVTGATAAAPVVRFGTVDGQCIDAAHMDCAHGDDPDDFFTFTISGTRAVVIQAQFFGTGAGGSANPDIDLSVLNNAGTAFVGTAFTAGEPETVSLAALAAGTYHVWVNAWDTGAGMFPYRLTIHCTTAGGC